MPDTVLVELELTWSEIKVLRDALMAAHDWAPSESTSLTHKLHEAIG